VMALMALTVSTVASAKTIADIPPDLQTPPLTNGAPAPGKRVRPVRPEFDKTKIYHTLYLPVGAGPSTNRRDCEYDF
jgi:hypothetical protein